MSRDSHDTHEDLTEFTRGVTSAPPPPTQEQIRDIALANLAALGGKLTKEDDIVFSGSKFILPAHTSLSDAVDFLEQRMHDEEQEYEFTKTFPYRPWDGAHATAIAVREAFGFSSGKPIRTFFGTNPPELIDIPTGVNTTEQVPWGAMTIPGLANTTLYLGSTKDRELGIIFQIAVSAPRKYRHHIDGLLQLIRKVLDERSIYRGHAIDGKEMPSFIDVNSVTEADVVYTQEVMRQLEANVWSPIRHAAQLELLRQPGKRSVLFEGPYGSGKTLGALLTAQIAEANGWTFILCRPGVDDLTRTMETARMYQPAVVFFEDLDVVAGTGDKDGVSKILDTFDGIKTKGVKMLLVLTTNHVEKIHKGMVRPGRLDAVIHIGEMDRPGVEKLTRRVVGTALAPSVDFDEVFDSMHGFMPAFVKEALDRAVRYSVARNAGELGAIDTEDIVLAANGLRPQLELMSNAKDEHHAPRIEEVIRETVADVVNKATLVSRNGSAGHVLRVDPNEAQRISDSAPAQ